MLFVGYYLETQTDAIWHFVQMGFLFTMLLLAVSIPSLIYISNRIAAPVNEAVGVLGEISEGNFDARIVGNHKGDLAVLQNTVNDTALQLSIYLKEKLQEDKIRELAAIVSISDAAIIMNDLNGAVRQWNIGAENILGYTQQEIIGRTPHAYAPEQYHASIDEIISRIQKGEHIAHLETVRKHKDGRHINCSASYTPILDGDGSVTGIVSIFHDITNEKLAEEKARNLAAIVAIADAGIIVKDRNGIITQWNIGAKNILGFEPEEVIGYTVHCYVPEEYHSGIDDIDAKLAAGEHIIHAETIRRHKNGHLVNCSASYTPIFDKQNNFAGAVAIFHDITANKLAEEKTRNLAAIVAIADAGIIVKDKHGVVLEWNIGAENIFGYKPEEMIGHTTHHYAPAESYDRIDEIMRRLEKGEHIVHVEVVRKHKEGRLVDCSASYTPIFDDNGVFTGSVAVFHDISDKKQMELALEEAHMQTEEKHQTIMESMEYAKKIQTSLLPQDLAFENAFSDYSTLWKPRDTVGGDIYWIKNCAEGTVLCCCDCTGHGTPGALLTMLVVSALEATINEDNYKDTAQVVWELDQKLVSVFNVNSDVKTKSKLSEVKDGCDLAVFYIANDGRVTISSGNTHLFICDGKKVTRIKGQRVFVGEGGLKSKNDVQIVEIPANPDNKFYTASDGLYDQIGGERERPFGYATFERIILKNHHKSLPDISDMIWEAFESYRGDQPRRDDVGLITFKPRGCS